MDRSIGCDYGYGSVFGCSWNDSRSRTVTTWRYCATPSVIYRSHVTTLVNWSVNTSG